MKAGEKKLGDSGSWALLGAASPELQQRAVLGGTLLQLYELCYLSKDFFMRTLLAASGVSWGDKQQQRGVVPAGPDLLRELLETTSKLSLVVKVGVKAVC